MLKRNLFLSERDTLFVTSIQRNTLTIQNVADLKDYVCITMMTAFITWPFYYRILFDDRYKLFSKG